MLAGRPHEAAGNGSPRWMAAGPRKWVHRTRPTGRLTRRLNWDNARSRGCRARCAGAGDGRSVPLHHRRRGACTEALLILAGTLEGRPAVVVSPMIAGG